jgi:multiple sugar transport system permease protein
MLAGQRSRPASIPGTLLGMPRKLTKLCSALCFHALAAALVLLFAAPLLWVLLVSLRSPGLPPPRGIEWLVEAPAWANYARIFELVPLGQFLVNTLLVVALAVPLTIVVASWAGFAMAQLPARLAAILIVLAVLLRMVPVTALWLTRFEIFKHLGAIDTLWALIAPAWMGSSPFFVLLFYWSFRRMPRELIESARLEGMGALRIWAQIALPLARPAIAAVAVLSCVQYWSDFINPLLYLKSEERYTLAVGLRVLQQLDITAWPLLMAGTVVMTAPLVLIFLLAQRAFWPESRMAGVFGK